MNVPLSWLEKFLPELPGRLDQVGTGGSRLETLVDLLNGIGLAVERVFERPAPPEGVVVARTESVSKIENSDHLLHAEVNDGTKRYSVVTGAPNTAVGLLTALAKPGAALPGAGFTVSVREMAGVQSEGVLCSPRELGLYDYGGGLIVFGEDAPVGTELADLWAAETVLELELTPNRADAFSILGVARDLAAKLGLELKNPAEGLEPGDPSTDDGLTVSVEDEEGCPRFTLRRIDNLTVAPSPVWLQRRLASLGLRPRNNVVDVTNYVTFELGHPSHAYDLDALEGGAIVVRRARAKESLTTLNEETVALDPQDLVITTPVKEEIAGGNTKPIGLAGVIGGLHDSVTKGTTSVALELAHWDPVTIRKTAKRHGLSTDAHYRFERGVDPNLPPSASARAAHLIAELGGGTLHPGLTDVGSDVPSKEVAFRPSRVAFLMALDIPLEEQQTYLERLGCEVEVLSEDEWRVTIPSWRFDLGIEEDLTEEVSRLYGYEHVPETIPAMPFVPEPRDDIQRNLRSLLVGLGLQETITYIFSSDAELARAGAPDAQVRLLNPQGTERSVLRTALYPGLLAAARTNRAAERLALFEVGRVFGAEERERLAILVRGPWISGSWLQGQETDFFTFKGILEKLAGLMGAEVRLEPEHHSALHPGVSAAVYWNARKVGVAGRVHPEVAAHFELPETYVAELDLPLTASPITFRDPPRQPFAERDLAIVAPQEVTYQHLAELASKAGGEKLQTLTPFDVYEGEPVPEGSRSVALRLRFRHPERALEGEEVDGYMANIISAFARARYTIRE